MKSITFFLLVGALVLYGILTIAVCSAVWNADTKAVLDALAGVLFAANGWVIFRKAMALSKTIKDNGGVK